MDGHAGKILYVDLTNRKTRIIPTRQYESWIGGHGMGSALFFDLVKDKTIDGFHPDNLVTVMASPLSGSFAPGGSSRTEVQGIGVQSVPIGWFTRSNFGGRFSTMVKMAGWDGIAVQGQADQPVWLDIRDDSVAIRDCSELSLWGTTTRDCQEKIWDYIAGDGTYGDWIRPIENSRDMTTQRPAILTIGPSGENISRVACLIHDSSQAAGNGGFGAVWGSKRLKAISVIGTGGIKLNSPKAMVAERLRQVSTYGYDMEHPNRNFGPNNFHGPPSPGMTWRHGRPRTFRAQGCVGCHASCKARFEDGIGNEATCMATAFYPFAKDLKTQRKATELLNLYGLNAHEMNFTLSYLRDLYYRRVLGPGRKIDCPLNFRNYGSYEFVEQFVKMISYRDDGLGNPHPFGDDIAEGVYRMAEKHGLLEGENGDLRTGRLRYPHWGLPVHYEPGSQVEWGYGTLLGDRGINEHEFVFLMWDGFSIAFGGRPKISAEDVVKIITDKMVPFEGDRHMVDYSDENLYSEHMVKFIAWHRYYTRFWKQSLLLCDYRWPDLVNLKAPDYIGSTGESEPAFLKAVTGEEFSFKDGIELGKKIWNLDHAIWTLQGRHRDMVKFADFMYSKRSSGGFGGLKYYLPGAKNGKWSYMNVNGRRFDRDGVEEFKTRFYQFHHWDPSSGYPTRKALDAVGLSYVADELEANDKLGLG